MRAAFKLRGVGMLSHVVGHPSIRLAAYCGPAIQLPSAREQVKEGRAAGPSWFADLWIKGVEMYAPFRLPPMQAAAVAI